MATAISQELVQEQGNREWNGFDGGLWQKAIDVRDFIQQNYTPYEGDESFLAPATERTKKIWDRLNELFIEERKKESWTFRRSRHRSQRMRRDISTRRTR